MTFTLRIFDRETCESKLNKAQKQKAHQRRKGVLC